MTLEPRQLLPSALAAVDLARDLIRTSEPGTVTEKTDRDLVSDVDVAIERAVRDYLRRSTPGIRFLGEEEGGPSGDLGTCWLWAFDPIDGTSNFTRGIPLCAISLALIHDGHPVLGIIDAPFLGEQYHAAEGHGAWCSGQRLSASSTTTLREAIVAIGDYATGHQAGRKNETQLAATVHLTPRVHRIRMLGTAALDLAWVAAGRLDASITFSNNPWDTAAGVIIAREAGAAVTDYDGTPHNMDSAATIAAPAQLIPHLMPLIQTATTIRPQTPDAQITHASPYADLDRILSRARHLLFDLDGPINGKPAATPAGYLYEALAACKDSGRTTAVIAAASRRAATGYLARHGLDDQVQSVITLNGQTPGHHHQAAAQLIQNAISELATSPSECALITASAATVHAAHAAGLATIGYIADQKLTDAHPDASLPSLADLALRLRARPLMPLCQADDGRGAKASMIRGYSSRAM